MVWQVSIYSLVMITVSPTQKQFGENTPLLNNTTLDLLITNEMRASTGVYLCILNTQIKRDALQLLCARGVKTFNARHPQTTLNTDRAS